MYKRSCAIIIQRISSSIIHCNIFVSPNKKHSQSYSIDIHLYVYTMIIRCTEHCGQDMLHYVNLFSVYILMAVGPLGVLGNYVCGIEAK